MAPSPNEVKGVLVAASITRDGKRYGLSVPVFDFGDLDDTASAWPTVTITDRRRLELIARMFHDLLRAYDEATVDLDAGREPGAMRERRP